MMAVHEAFAGHVICTEDSARKGYPLHSRINVELSKLEAVRSMTWKYYQSASKLRAQALQNLTVQ